MPHGATTPRFRSVRLDLLAAPLLLLLAPFAVGPTAFAQSSAPLRVGVIVSDEGPAAARGTLERTVAEAFERRANARGGVFGLPLELEIRSDGSDARRAERTADELIAEGVHALICCSTPAATERVGALAAQQRVPVLSPSGGGDADAAGWQHTLAPSERSQLRAVVQDAFVNSWWGLGLLAPDTSLGTDAQRILEEELRVAQMALVATRLYELDAMALTPEALWVATRQPSAVIVWGLRDDTGRAVDALRRRGWTGPVYLRGSLLAALGDGLPTGLSDGARIPLPPAALADALPGDDPHAEAVATARQLGNGRLGSRPHAADGALMHDALALLAQGLEEAISYGVSHEEVEVFRQALRDALVSVGSVTLAAGSYDPRDDRTDASLPQGLHVAELRGGRPLPGEAP